MPIVKLSIAENTVTEAQKEEVVEGIKKLLIDVMHKDPKRIYITVEEAPLDVLRKRIAPKE